MSFNRVEVFSATKHRDRGELGDRVTRFLQGYGGEVVDKVVAQSSDAEFHCLSVVLFCKDAQRPRPQRNRTRKRWLRTELCRKPTARTIRAFRKAVKKYGQAAASRQYAAWPWLSKRLSLAERKAEPAKAKGKVRK
jgi:hypothetical protein